MNESTMSRRVLFGVIGAVFVVLAGLVVWRVAAESETEPLNNALSPLIKGADTATLTASCDMGKLSRNSVRISALWSGVF